MKTKRFLKDKKITIIGITQGENSMGDPIEIEGPIPGGENIWAYYRQASAKEYLAAAATQYKVEAIFIINYRTDIDTSMKIKFRDQMYEITRIDDFEGYKKDLQIYAYTTGRD